MNKKILARIIAIAVAILLAMVAKVTAQTSYSYEQSEGTIYKVTKETLFVKAPPKLPNSVITSLDRDGLGADTITTSEQMQFPLGVLFENKITKVMVYEVNGRRVDVSEIPLKVVTYKPNIAVVIMLLVVFAISCLASVDIKKDPENFLRKNHFWENAKYIFAIFALWIVSVGITCFFYSYPNTFRITSNSICGGVLVSFFYFIPITRASLEQWREIKQEHQMNIAEINIG